MGINAAPISVAAGHYYQGRIGQRLWRRLERIGLLRDAVPGAEDEAFARAGHGLTDLVKRPAPSAELEAGVDVLRAKVREWKPGLVLFAFADPARRAVAGLTPPRRRQTGSTVSSSSLVGEREVLRVSRGHGGVVLLD